MKDFIEVRWEMAGVVIKMMVNVNHISRYYNFGGSYSKIIMYNGEVIEVNESAEEITKKIIEAQASGD